MSRGSEPGVSTLPSADPWSPYFGDYGAGAYAGTDCPEQALEESRAMSSRVRRSARAASAEDGVKVTVTQGIQVFHDGQTYRDGQSVTVPQTVARRWIRNGWASDSGPSVLRDPRGLARFGANNREPQSESMQEADPTPARASVQSRRDPRKPKGSNRVNRS